MRISSTMSNVLVTETGFQPTTTKFLNDHSTSLTKRLSVCLQTKWLWVPILLMPAQVFINFYHFGLLPIGVG